jgi:acetolactate synthase-1/2/3 large subunit
MTDHAPATSASTLYGSDQLAELLRGLGYKYAFINPGSSFRGLHDSVVNHLGNERPEFVLTTHEMIAVGMAHGYSKASGEPSLCILHNLVGLMNGSMGVFNAFCDQVPMLLLGGSGPADPAERRFIDWAHTANTQGDLVRSYVKWTDEPATLDAAMSSILAAQRKALTAPYGPAYVSIDAGLQEAPIDAITLPDLNHPSYGPAPAPHPDPEMVQRVAEALVSARLPLIFGGRFGLCCEVTAALTDLIELVGAAYQDDRNIVCVATEHPQNLNGDTSLRGEADILVCFDCQDVTVLTTGYNAKRSAILTAGQAEKDALIVDVSLNQYFGNSWSRFGGPVPLADITIAADPLVTLKAITTAVRALVKGQADIASRVADRRQTLAQRKAALVAKRQEGAEARWEQSPSTLARVTHEVYEAVKAYDWVLTVRNHRSWQEGFWPIDTAGRYLGGDGGGGVGYGPAAAAGAALALKGTGKLPVAMIGDGDFLMAPGAIWSAANHGAPLLVVILNNRTWGNDELHQIEVAEQRGRAVENAHIGQRMADPDIAVAAIAKGMGAWTRGPIDKPEDLAAALAEAVDVVRAGGVAVVEVLTQLQ